MQCDKADYLLCPLFFISPPKVRQPLAPEDEELLRDDDELVTPVKRDGIRKKERPTDKGVSWLVKTQYISPLSMESAKQVGFSIPLSLNWLVADRAAVLKCFCFLQSLTEKQAKELRESKVGRNLLENLNNRSLLFHSACL